MAPNTADATAIDYFSSRHPARGLATRLALRARTAMFRRFVAAVRPEPSWSVVDIGVTPDRELADSNFFEAMYPHPHRITATSIEDASFLAEVHPGLRFVQTDGDRLPFADGEFDLAFSSAVLEHVGDTEAQRRFIAEMCRVADRFFLTTPNRWFPIEVHTFLPVIHWLPQRWHQRILRLLGKDFWARTEHLNLVSAHDLRQLFPANVDVVVASHRTAGWPSNLIAHGSVRRP